MKKLGRAPRISITVSDYEIDHGIGRDSSHCMIAEALKANLPWAKYVSADLQTIRVSDVTKRERYIYLTPRIAQIALVQFDQGIKPKPFTFQLRRGHVVRIYSNQVGQKLSNQKASLRRQQGGAGRGRSIPERVGGKPPPTARGMRRAFGIRSLEM